MKNPLVWIMLFFVFLWAYNKFFKNKKYYYKEDNFIKDISLNILNSKNIQYICGDEDRIKSLNPYLKLNINESLISNKKSFSAQCFKETNYWYCLVDCYRIHGSEKIGFTLYLINKNNRFNSNSIETVVKEINLISKDLVQVELHENVKQ